APDTNAQDWLNAQTRCNIKTVGNRQGWRLPTLQELASLVDPTIRFSPTLPVNPFTNVQSSIYWSATSAANTSAIAWFVSFADGHVANAVKHDRQFVWCECGGQGVHVQLA